ncbi:eukaryotic translation initiation factor 2A-like [Diadema antillarum]|uniref:eukaryotic translation initiation factor 2A-like n=1 Tax=Diadema antillarum TaxID=105358 RepID=UPI003A8B1184
MASSQSVPCPQLAVRGTEGVFMIEGPPSFAFNETFGRDAKCNVMVFGPKGRQFAYCNGQSVFVMQLPNCETLLQVDRPKTSSLAFSPKGKYLATWEVYYVTPEMTGPNPNVNVWDIATGRCVKSYILRQHDAWQPQWTNDERICAVQANSEIHFFENRDYGKIVNRLHLPKVMCQMSKAGSPPHVAAHIPGNKGAPHAVRLFQYPKFDGPGSMLANKSFYKADKVEMLWNRKGSAVLVVATQEVDSTGSSYYGETSLHFLSVTGDSSNVSFGKKGPIYSVDWNPNSTEFCVVYGFMPAKATLFNLKCEPVYDFGTGPRNCVYFNPQGTMLALGGFANLRGHIQIWDRKSLKMISQSQAADATVFQWSPDGQHYATAVCAPRLRVGNGYKIWHVSGSLLHEKVAPDDKTYIFDIVWQTLPAELFKDVVISKPTAPIIQSSEPQASKEVYRPPSARGKPSSFKLNEDEPPQALQQAQNQNLSKSALKNKKKREAKAKAKQDTANMDTRSAEQRAALATANFILSDPAPAPAVGADVEAEKKLKNLRKKLKQIEKLKEQQASGKELEKNQLEKLTQEEQLLAEIAKLELQ